jgi:hypothetical protein
MTAKRHTVENCSASKPIRSCCTLRPARGASGDLTAKAGTICYEIVQEFAQLYRRYRKITVAAMADEETLRMKAHFHRTAE